MKRRIKRWGAVLLGFVLTVNSGLCVQAETEQEQILREEYEKTIETNEIEGWPKGPEIYPESAIVMDAETGTVLYGKGIDKKQYPASITKVLTALVAVENSRMEDKVTFSWDSVHCLKPGYAHIAMQTGEEISMKDALHGLLLASANEVAYAIGETVGGTHEKFIKMMNDKAAELGCKTTHFTNTNGMFDEKHYTSAYDMALITRAAFSHQELLDVAQTLQYRIEPTNKVDEPRIFQQKHKMLLQGKYHDDRCIAGKTGYTEKAHNTLVTVMKSGGQTLIAVVMNSQKETFEATKKICDYAFKNFKNVNIAENETGKEFEKIDENAYVTIPKKVSFDDLEHKTDGQGNVTYYYKGQTVGSAKAVLKKETKIVKKTETKPKETVHMGTVTKTIIIVAAIAAVTAALILVTVRVKTRDASRMRRARRRRRRHRQRHSENHWGSEW